LNFIVFFLNKLEFWHLYKFDLTQNEV